MSIDTVAFYKSLTLKNRCDIHTDYMNEREKHFDRYKKNPTREELLVYAIASIDKIASMLGRIG
jgi:hypothetical protein